MTKRSKFTAAGVAAALAFSGVAAAASEWGSVAHNDGTIYACYGADGTMKVKEVGADVTTCAAGEKRMSFAQRGMRGPTGPMGRNGTPYFARILTTDNNTSKPAATTMKTWNYNDGTVWINMPAFDVRQCVVSATPVTGKLAATAVRQDADYKDWILLYTAVNGARTHMALDVAVSCHG